MHCIKCGAKTQDYFFQVLPVQTLHIRDIPKEKKVQALGDFEEYCVCASCAQRKYEQHIHVREKLLKTCVFCGLLMLVGLILTVIFWTGEGALRLLGLGMLVCGGLYIFGTVRDANAKTQELKALPMEKALYRCAWECLVDGAPKKYDINDITYIPIDEETLSRKNGDLMLLYDLLPEIAIEAHKRIHNGIG